MKNKNMTKRVISLFMTLMLATGVFLCISSCEEAGDTSSPKTESDTSNVGSTGRDIIAKSAVKDAWNDYVYGTSTKSILAWFGADKYMVAAIGYNEDHFIRSKNEIAEVNDVLKEFESHIVKEITKAEFEEINEQRRAESPDDYYLNLADITMYDGSPEIVYGFGLEPATLGRLVISINEDYLIVSGVGFKLDGDVSAIIEKIKSIRER